MNDNDKNGAKADHRPENQKSEAEGPIKQAQRDEHSKRGQETNRGSEPATGAASRNRN